MSYPSLHHLPLTADPAEVFARVAHLPGSVFLDSSNAGAGTEALSLIAFDPEDVLTGNLANPGSLERWLEQNAWSQAPDCGFPLGAAIGTIDYDGAYTFGLYPRLLIYHHPTRAWTDVGGLSQDLPSEVPEFEPLPAVTFTAEMDRAAFVDRVKRAKNYIAAGDIYQINLTRRYQADWPGDSNAYPFYEQLRTVSPVSYAAYLNLAERQVLSASPEQFLRLSSRQIQTRPIKGTRPRFRDSGQDERSRYDLLTSDKEIAELIMITDLERNDLGQICEFGSVHAAEILKLEAYEQVFHLVSTVRGTLNEGHSHLDALRACFPGGSITGAPKKRACELIQELEDVPRGLYTGAIGYLGLNGESQFNIAIRTLIQEAGRLHFHVGAGIVADSDPDLEFEETEHKAAGIFQTLEILRENGLSLCNPQGREEG